MKKHPEFEILIKFLNVSEEDREKYYEDFMCVDEYVMRQNLSFSDMVTLSAGLTCTLFMLLESGIDPGDREAFMSETHARWDARRKEEGFDDKRFFFRVYNEMKS